MVKLVLVRNSKRDKRESIKDQYSICKLSIKDQYPISNMQIIISVILESKSAQGGATISGIQEKIINNKNIENMELDPRCRKAIEWLSARG